ncbi:DUF4157 domain-containing protein [Tahibacter sp.]|uniref:eCIS core domain-containing protein n=1 Tax=Tahibacter sp. TaxID=2056211 RepID=UPI0028C37A75|nr:DUF4157 domain-containing protein [Tahibacter sp.]
MQRKAVGSTHAGRGALPQAVGEGLDSPAQPLDMATRAFFEPRLQHDLSDVRVHAGARAAASAAAVRAQAYTVGRDLVFGEGRYDPHSGSGRELLAHELTHVVQQSAAGPPRLQRRVVDSDYMLPCRAAPGRDAATLRAREQQGAAWATAAATALRATPISETARKLLWRRIRRDANDPRVRCRMIPTLADRFERIAKALRDDIIRYDCSITGEPTFLCNGSIAVAWPILSSTINLCSPYWSTSPQEQALTLMHECMHLYFGTRGIADGSAGGFDTAECYPAFALELAGLTLGPTENANCPPNPDPLPARDAKRLAAPCPSNVFPTLSIGGGYANGLPGVGPAATWGLGLELGLPLTRMHEWELTLGARFQQFLPVDADKQKAYLLGVRTGINYRFRPWRFGFQAGGHLEAGSIGLPGNERGGGNQQAYGLAGGSTGLTVPLPDHQALQLMLEAGRGFDVGRAGDKHLDWFQTGLSIGIQFQ